VCEELCKHQYQILPKIIIEALQQKKIVILVQLVFNLDCEGLNNFIMLVEIIDVIRWILY
jgi:hypothetical protein